MANNNSVCETDILYVGLTRPPMFYGITDAYGVFMVCAVMTIFLGLGGLQGILYGGACAPALYVFGYVMCEREPRTFQLWSVKLVHFSMGKRRSEWWGGSSFDPGCGMTSGQIAGARKTLKRA